MNMPSLEIFLFGNPHILLEGTPVELATNKATALLSYLAMVGGKRSRDGLAAFLWPELDNQRGHAALRTTLWRINQVLPGWLDTDYYTVTLSREDIRVDVVDFERLLRLCREHPHTRESFSSLDYPGSRVRNSICCRDCLSWLKEAVSYAKIGFMEGFSLKDSLAFDEWQRTLSERIEYELSDAYERLVAGNAGVGDIGKAIEAAHRWVAMDRYSEEGLRQIMWLHYLNGNRMDALRYYQNFTANLRKEAGYDIEPSTAHLYSLIRTGYISQDRKTGRIREVAAANFEESGRETHGAKVYNSEAGEPKQDDEESEMDLNSR